MLVVGRSGGGGDGGGGCGATHSRSEAQREVFRSPEVRSQKGTVRFWRLLSSASCLGRGAVCSTTHSCCVVLFSPGAKREMGLWILDWNPRTRSQDRAILSWSLAVFMVMKCQHGPHSAV